MITEGLGLLEIIVSSGSVATSLTAGSAAVEAQLSTELALALLPLPMRSKVLRLFYESRDVIKYSSLYLVSRFGTPASFEIFLISSSSLENNFLNLSKSPSSLMLCRTQQYATASTNVLVTILDIITE